MKFGFISLNLLAVSGLSGCDISPEKHHNRAEFSNNAEGGLVAHSVGVRPQSLSGRSVSP